MFVILKQSKFHLVIISVNLFRPKGYKLKTMYWRGQELFDFKTEGAENVNPEKLLFLVPRQRAAR